MILDKVMLMSVKLESVITLNMPKKTQYHDKYQVETGLKRENTLYEK